MCGIGTDDLVDFKLFLTIFDVFFKRLRGIIHKRNQCTLDKVSLAQDITG